MMIDDAVGLKRVLTECSVLAVVGMKGPGEGPAWYVPRYMREQGYVTLPVNPKYDQIDGVKSVASVLELSERVDMVVVFRRPEFIDELATEILQMSPLPRVVWMQLGIRNAAAAERLVAAGIDVVQDRCLYIDHPRLMG